ncbi:MULTISPECIES: response regulator [Aeromonas]|jgi:two-component system chemotaxis response regulator CheY|uniref:Response regulator n=1 Tax=Aeromonas hydrophila TaxID=644 RepID=A0A7U6LJ64_AERHY|nr:MULTISPECIES: response regulator [Aeromonas]HEB4995342.1 response regulator [Aeromonas hydrophila subsp. hydrophila]AKA17027.1 chemotaxis protein CheY [Aeromonas hydrophila]APJ15771.1 two-component system response regulator [Aeromonas hydrophila]EJN6955936.1 response regulator [Aeromonas hydrophila]ELA9379191.1 response regulator [Aeromonas hydrophila]
MSKTILVVDDSVGIRAAITMTLSSAGFEVIEAGDGEAALIELDQRRVHLIISDLNMPGMDGMTLLRRVKAQQTTRYLPFIMLTTEDSEQIKREGFEAGARIWLTKPFEPLKLLDDVCKVVQP